MKSRLSCGESSKATLTAIGGRRCYIPPSRPTAGALHRYLAYGPRHADLLFEVVSRRYAVGKPIVITTNKPFADWGETFPNATCVVTLVDRLVHRSEIVLIQGDSYRLKESKEQSAARKEAREMSA